MKTTMKILFVDCDEVLNSTEHPGGSHIAAKPFLRTEDNP